MEQQKRGQKLLNHESKGGVHERDWREKRKREEWCNYILISKNKFLKSQKTKKKKEKQFNGIFYSVHYIQNNVFTIFTDMY